jgi:hypothetical protein
MDSLMWKSSNALDTTHLFLGRIATCPINHRNHGFFGQSPRSPSQIPPGAAAPPVSARAPETGARRCISGGRPPGDALRPLTPAPASCCALLSSEVVPASRAREGYITAPRRSVYQRIVDRAIRRGRLCGSPEPASLLRTCSQS